MQTNCSLKPFLAVLSAVVASGALSTVPQTGAASQEALRKALTFHASFDGKLAAVHAAGDPALYWTSTLKQRQDAKPGLPESGEVQHAIGAGRFGDALRFTTKK